MACLGEIDGGSAQARAELLFLTTLLVQLGDRVEPGADLSGALGFSDVYRSSTFGAGDFIRVEKPSVGLLKDLAALRVRASNLVAHLIEVASGHDGPHRLRADGATEPARVESPQDAQI